MMLRPDEMCPECEAVVPIQSGIKLNDHATCPHCGLDLTVVSINPIKLQLVLPEKEELTM